MMFILFWWHKYRLNKKVLEKLTPRTYIYIYIKAVRIT